MNIPARIGRCAIYRDPADCPADAGAAVTIGRFDGVHAGHRELLAATRETARELGLARTLAVTFWPPPEWVVRSDAPREVLTGLGDRLELLAATGLDAIVVWTFDADLAAHSPEQFLQRLHTDLRMRALLTGPNAHIGKDRAGTSAVIRVICDRLGVTYRTVPWHGPPGATTSSALRDALRRGDLAPVNAGLGRPYSLVGTVGRGDQRGRELGFPTANLDLPDWLLLPADGIYTAQALLHSDGRASECWRAAVSVGVRPTFGPGRRIVEAHLVDFDRDIYGRELRLFLRQWLRAGRAFPDVDALVREMDRDVARARSLPQPDPADLLPFAVS